MKANQRQSMWTEDDETVFAPWRAQGLSAEEKEVMRWYLWSRIREHGVKAQSAEKASAVSAFLDSFFRKPAAVFASMAFIVLASGGFSIACVAEGAIPGERLYAMKTDVNEPVMGWFRMTPEEKARWRRELVARRVGEADVLAFRGELGEAERANVEKLLGEQASDSVGEVFVREASRKASRVEVEVEKEAGRSRYRIRIRAGVEDDGHESEDVLEARDKVEARMNDDSEHDDRAEIRVETRSERTVIRSEEKKTSSSKSGAAVDPKKYSESGSSVESGSSGSDSNGAGSDESSGTNSSSPTSDNRTDSETGSGSADDDIENETEDEIESGGDMSGKDGSSGGDGSSGSGKSGG